MEWQALVLDKATFDMILGPLEDLNKRGRDRASMEGERLRDVEGRFREQRFVLLNLEQLRFGECQISAKHNWIFMEGIAYPSCFLDLPGIESDDDPMPIHRTPLVC